MTKVILIRHGYSEANKSKIFAGGMFDAPLTELGQSQGDKVSEYIAENYTVDALYSSPLSRAQNTVKKLSALTGLPVCLENGLREIEGGKWERLSFSEIVERYPEDFRAWEESLGLCRPTGGESFQEVRDRMLKTLEKIARENEGKTVAVVSHSCAIRAFRAGVANIPLERVDHSPAIPNASISSVIYENGRWKEEFFGYADYLGEFVTNLPANL